MNMQRPYRATQRGKQRQNVFNATLNISDQGDEDAHRRCKYIAIHPDANGHMITGLNIIETYTETVVAASRHPCQQLLTEGYF
jgi:hypothetical protein